MFHTNSIILIGGGPSAKGIDFSPFKGKAYILGVNDAGIYAPVDGVFSMDRLWSEARIDYFKDKPIDVFLRHTVFDGLEKKGKTNASVYRIETHFDRHFLSDEPFIVHGRNSGFCALNFALLWDVPENVYLFGFDMQGSEDKVHWYAQYEWSTKKNGNHYRKWAEDFDKEYPKIKEKFRKNVYNCSKTSRIKAIPYKSYGDVINEIK